MVATSLPRISRETATRISVTVTSPALGEVTERQRALETALADGGPAAVATAAARLRVALNDLTPSEWIPIRAEIEDLLARADRLVDGASGDDETPGVSSTAPSTTQPGGAPVATQPTTTSSPIEAASPAAPSPTTARPGASGATSSSVTAGGDEADDADVEDDNSGPGNGDDNSGPGGGDTEDDNSGPGSD